MQADDSDEARAAEAREAAGGPCEFDRTEGGLRLRPIMFICRVTRAHEKDWHSYVGEVFCGIWAFAKFRHYLWGPEFTWITDCDGAMYFMEGEDFPSHTFQRWRMKLLEFHFVVVHRNAVMVTEVNLLTRYNMMADKMKLLHPPKRNPQVMLIMPRRKISALGYPLVVVSLPLDIINENQMKAAPLA